MTGTVLIGLRWLFMVGGSELAGVVVYSLRWPVTWREVQYSAWLLTGLPFKHEGGVTQDC